MQYVNKIDAILNIFKNFASTNKKISYIRSLIIFDIMLVKYPRPSTKVVNYCPFEFHPIYYRFSTPYMFCIHYQ